MNTKILLAALSLCASAQGTLAQGGGPPPQAFEDCRGKKAGDTVQHMTREGLVAASCESTPEGLIARPASRPATASTNPSANASPEAPA